MAIVRRGEADVFRTLTERIAQLHLAEVIWDRRRAERRAAQGSDSPADRRRRDRRQAAHGTWATLGFILTAVALPGTPAPGPAIL